MAVELLAEDAERARDERGDAVGVAAGAASRDLREPPAEDGFRRHLSSAVCELLEALCDRSEAVDARPALSGALLGEVPRDARRLGDATCVGGKDDDRARAERGADAREAG